MADVIYNGAIYNEGNHQIEKALPLFQSNFGLIETLLYDSGRMPYWIGHGRRIRKSFEVLGWFLPDRFLAQISDGIVSLVKANGLADKAKIRLTLFQQDGKIHFLLEALSLPEHKEPLKIGLAQGRVKPVTAFSFLKSNNRNFFEEAAHQAMTSGLQDALLLNESGRIIESTIANVFWEKEGRLFTPPLSEGCVAGVYRDGLLNGTILFKGMEVAEKVLTIKEAINADVLYLTNAIRGIRKVEALIIE